MARPAMQLEVGLYGSSHSIGGAQSICERTDCFVSALRERADSGGTVILAVTNAGFASFWHNLRCSMERVGVGRHALIVGTDHHACVAALAPGVACLVGERLFWPEEAAAELDSGAVSHGTPKYARLMHVKARPTLEALRLGYNVLTTDTDIVFFRDPLAHLRRLRTDEHVLIQSDYHASNDASCSRHGECWRSQWCEGGACAEEVCGGFHWMAASPEAVALLEGMFSLFEQQRGRGDSRTGEQPALNYALRRTAGVRFRALPRALYPNGAAFFARGARLPDAELPYLVHNNWISGLQAKRDRFERHALWLARYRPAADPTSDAEWTCAETALHATPPDLASE